MLYLEGVRCQRGWAEQSFTLEVPRLLLSPGEMLAVTGESGSGKSTLLEVLGLVLRPQQVAFFSWQEGEGKDQQEDIAALWRRRDQRRLARMRAQRIGFVLQTGGLLPFLSVQENLAVNRRLLGLPAEDAAISALVDKLEIAPLLKKKPHQLSIGERQRVSIGRALAHGPRLVLADEPTAALDPRLANNVMELLLELVQGAQTTAVIATHARESIKRFGVREIRAERVDSGMGYASRFQG